MKKHAVLAGVNHYEDEQIRNLKYSIDDVVAMDKVLERLGFATIRLYDPSHEDIQDAIRRATAGLGAGDVFLFFFSGHGFSVGEQNFVFCPKDKCAALVSGSGAGLSSSNIGDYARAVSREVQFDRIFVYDACRNYYEGHRGCAEESVIPFPDGTRVCTRDLNPLASYARSCGGYDTIMRSCKSGEVSHEIKSTREIGNGYGVFTQALTEVMGERLTAHKDVTLDSSFHEDVVKRVNSILREREICGVQTPEINIVGKALCLRASRRVSAEDAKVAFPEEENEAMPFAPAADLAPAQRLPESLDEPFREAVESVWKFCSATMGKGKVDGDKPLQEGFKKVLDVSFGIWREVFDRQSRKPDGMDVRTMTAFCRELGKLVRDRLVGRRVDFRAVQCLADVQAKAEKLKGTPCEALAEAMLECVQKRSRT